MKLELLILACTAFFVANTYYEGYYLQKLLSWKKYYVIVMYVFLGLCLYLFLKRNPDETRNVMIHANRFIKYLPIDRDAMDMLTPVLDFGNSYTTQQKNSSRIMYSGGGGGGGGSGGRGRGEEIEKSKVKRSVSETKKKYVASEQQWKCGHCKAQLNAWFEVDHKTKLEHGGSNHISNLVALCRDCHGKKTTMENL